MKYVEVIAETGSSDTVSAIADKFKARDFRLGTVGDDGLQPMRLVVSDDKIQGVLDTLQNVLGAQPSARILVMPVETALPRLADEERKEEDAATKAREALYTSAEKDARLTQHYLVLVILSTIVAAIGLIEDSVAVIIGAMVIAPLIGPNIAFGLGTALGDTVLMRKAALTLSAGIASAIVLSAVIGVFWTSDMLSPELMARTEVGLDSVALALASGAAAALSLMTGLSSVLVGVMVAVALLPPAAAFGLMIGHGDVGLALGAGLLLVVNVVCVNLATKLVFLIKGIGPRTWYEKEKARRAMKVYVTVWIVTLVFLVFVIYTREALAGR